MGWRGRKARGLLDPNGAPRKAMKVRYGSTIVDKLCALNRFGMKNGKGWFEKKTEAERGGSWRGRQREEPVEGGGNQV